MATTLKTILTMAAVLFLAVRFSIAQTNSSASVHEAPDVLSATNLEQWKSLITDLKQVRGLPDDWSAHRTKIPFVLLKHNGHSMIFRTETIDVTTIDAQDFMGAEIDSPKMDIDETRKVGLKLCEMFGFDSKEFVAWCDKVGNKWLDAPLFNTGDPNHSFRIRRSYNDEEPWVFNFIIWDTNTASKMLGTNGVNLSSVATGTNTDTNDLVAIALRTHTKEAWQAVLYQAIDNSSNTKAETGTSLLLFLLMWVQPLIIIGLIVSVIRLLKKKDKPST